METKKYYNFYLPYFKQGDDLRHALDLNENDYVAAFRSHAEKLKESARLLTFMSEYVSQGVEIADADNHMIQLLIPEALGHTLENMGVVVREEIYEGDCEDELD